MEKRQNGQALTSFFLSDSSPMIHYTSTSTAGWTTGYALQSDGWDSTVHIASQNNSGLAFDITATSLSLLIPYFPNCTSTLTLNSSAPIPACASPTRLLSLQNLPLGLHHIVYNANALHPGQEISFWGVDATRPYDGPQWGNITIDDLPKGSASGIGSVAYTGEWQMEEGSAGALNRTLAGTSKKGAAAEFTGKGSAIYLYGNIGPQYSTAAITINGAAVESTLNFSSSWSSSYQVLWFKTGLDPSQDTKVVMTNLEDKRIALDFVLLTINTDTIGKLSSPNPFANTTPGKLVLFLLLPLTLLIIIALSVFCFMRHRFRTSRSANPLFRSDKQTLRNHESLQNLRKSYLDLGWERTSPQTVSADAQHFARQQRTYAGRSAKSGLSGMFVTYEEGKKRLSEKMRSMTTTTPDSPYTDSVQASPNTANHDRQIGSRIAMASPFDTQLAYLDDGPMISPLLPSKSGRWSQSSLLRSMEQLLGRSTQPLSPTTLNPDHHRDNINLPLTPPIILPARPPSASGSQVNHVQRMHNNIRMQLSHPNIRLGPSDPHSQTSPLHSHTLHTNEWDRSTDIHPFARFRLSDGPSDRTSFTFSDVLSVSNRAAPPSERGVEYNDFQSVHTGRSGVDNDYFTPNPIEALPIKSVSRGNTLLVPSQVIGLSQAKTQPLRIGSRPAPSAYPAQMSRSGSTSSSHRKPVPDDTSSQAATGSPARPESSTESSPLASPTMEAARMQREYERRSRYASGASRSSAYTTSSAARPDSEIMPFEEFVAGMKEIQRKAREV